jgi:A/G-specific adenine glycosylase
MKAPTCGLTLRARRRFRARLLDWYDRHQRNLPWRGERDPYRVWVSEIMLQQTRVNAVLEHYQVFLARFPDLRSLARATPAAVLTAWSGLGYYQRARAMHAAARRLARAHAKFPDTAAEMRVLPGIGRYTAAAIASIAFGEPCAVVDGNVERVLYRLFEVAGAGKWTAAEELLEERRPGDFNQAMMELGATVCLPQAPLCEQCPVYSWCRNPNALPAPAAIRRRKKKISFILARRSQRVRLVRRPATASLMPNMWELPLAAEANGRKPLFTVRHSITVTDYRVQVFGGDDASPARGGRWVNPERIHDLPLTGLARKILRRAQIIQVGNSRRMNARCKHRHGSA